MHNVNVGTLKQAIDQATADASTARQPVALEGDWQTAEGAPQFRATIKFPQGEVTFEADFPPSMGGTGSAPSPIAYCFWGGLACYAMTFAQQAALAGVELRSLKGSLVTEMDHTRALGVSQNPPVEKLEWTLDAQSDASPEQLAEIKRLADERCPAVWCLSNPVNLVTALA